MAKEKYLYITSVSLWFILGMAVIYRHFLPRLTDNIPSQFATARAEKHASSPFILRDKPNASDVTNHLQTPMYRAKSGYVVADGALLASRIFCYDAELNVAPNLLVSLGVSQEQNMEIHKIVTAVWEKVKRLESKNSFVEEAKDGSQFLVIPPNPEVINETEALRLKIAEIAGPMAAQALTSDSFFGAAYYSRRISIVQSEEFRSFEVSCEDKSNSELLPQQADTTTPSGLLIKRYGHLINIEGTLRSLQ